MATIPVDKTPAERARIKLIEYIAIIVLFNAVLALYVLTTGNKGPVNWPLVAVSAVSQGVLAGIAALEKYLKASGQPLLSDLLEQARQEGVKSVPSVTYTPDEDKLRQTVESVVQSYLQPPIAPVVDTQQAQAIVKPEWMKALSSDPPVPQPEAPILNTLPNLAAVQPPPVS